MKKNLSKQIIMGVILGCMLFTGTTAGAMTTGVDGVLYTRNPIYSAPQGYALTTGYKRIYAECSAERTKDGKKEINIKSKSSTSSSVVETDWVSGPSYFSSGTTFRSYHTGYDAYGTYKTLSASYKY